MGTIDPMTIVLIFIKDVSYFHKKNTNISVSVLLIYNEILLSFNEQVQNDKIAVTLPKEPLKY